MTSSAEHVRRAAESLNARKNGQAQTEPAPDATTGALPISGMIVTPPPPPLVGVFMATAEDTIMFGRGGSTKGTTAAFMALEVVKADPAAVVYVLDFEHHEGEWAGRIRRLGATDKHMGRIHYASPYAKAWTYPTGQLIEVWPYVKADCDRLNVTLLVIDSMTAASDAGEAMGGKQVADDYFRAVRQIGRRALHLAHVTGNAETWPDRPFGSVHIHNYARETWAIALTEETAPDTLGASSATAELRCKKAQDRPKPKPQVIRYSYEPFNASIAARLTERSVTRGDLVYESLLRLPAGKTLSTKAIAAAVKRETGETLSEAVVYDAIRRDSHGRFVPDKGKYPVEYKAAGT